MGLDELNIEQRTFFCKMVDESVMEADTDPELKECFNFLDELCIKQDITFYEVIFDIYELSELKKRIDELEEELKETIAKTLIALK